MSHEVPFLSASTVPQEFLVVSKIIAVRTHWEVDKRRARICPEHRCKRCYEGWGVKDRFLVRLEDPDGFHCLMEFGPRNAQVLRMVAQHQHSLRSCVVEVKRSGSAVNSPVGLDILRVVSSPELYDLSNLVKATYLAPMELEAEAVPEWNGPAPVLDSFQDTAFSQREREIVDRIALLRQERV